MRGFVFILESVFAGIIIVGFMLFLAQGYSGIPSSRENMLREVLPELDEEGILRAYAYSGDDEGLEDEISLYGYHHDVVFCGSGGCPETPQVRDNVWLSTYFLSGEDSYQPMEVRLYAWEA